MSKTVNQRELRPAARTQSISRQEIARHLKSAPKIDAKRFRKDVDSIIEQGLT
jgi:hypothetical protein